MVWISEQLLPTAPAPTLHRTCRWDARARLLMILQAGLLWCGTCLATSASSLADDPATVSPPHSTDALMAGSLTAIDTACQGTVPEVSKRPRNRIRPTGLSCVGVSQ